MKDEECMFRDCLKGGLSLSVFINSYISVCYLISVPAIRQPTILMAAFGHSSLGSFI